MGCSERRYSKLVKNDTLKIGKALRKRYILALSIIAFLVILSQGLIQYALIDQEGDSRVINIAGRQRMLSQRIMKCVLLIESPISEIERQTWREELGKSLTLWSKSHIGLRKGDIELGLPDKNSTQIASMFAKIEPNFQGMLKNATIIMEDGKDVVERKDAMTYLLLNQGMFLKDMDEIVFQYDAEAKGKVNTVKQLELGILFVTFLTLLLEAYFIFKPAELQLQKTFEEYQRSEAGLKSIFDMSPTPMVMMSLDKLQFVRVNSAASSLLNVSEENVDQKILGDYLETDAQTKVAWNQVLASESVAGIELPMHLRGSNAVVMAFTARTDYEGMPHMLMGFVDVTAGHIKSENLAYLAATESMTGLLNRRAFMERMEFYLLNAKKWNTELSIAFIDLDGLKMVNDTFGHIEGDWYISTVASLLRDTIREKDCAGRLGGDEFAIIFEKCSQGVAQDIVRRIQIQVESIPMSFGKPYFMGFSFGVVSVESGEEIDAETLIKKADEAMYVDKKERRLKRS